jgi:hypothetical protein
MSSVDQLVATLQDIKPESFSNEAERLRVTAALTEALRRVQSPWDIAWEHNWVNLATNAAIKTLIDARVFQKWTEMGGAPQTCDELARLTEVDPILLSMLPAYFHLSFIQLLSNLLRHHQGDC